jgi:hypothetical protein
MMIQVENEQKLEKAEKAEKPVQIQIAQESEDEKHKRLKMRMAFLEKPSFQLALAIMDIDVTNALLAKTDEDMWNGYWKIAVTGHVFILSILAKDDANLQEHLG